MKKFKIMTAVVLCLSSSAMAHDAGSEQIGAVRSIITAVNAKDADAYVEAFCDDVVIKYHGGEVRVRGREAMRENREQHFTRYPDVRNELVHLVAIDNKVVMHDRVWLEGSESPPADIVEVFTFRHGRIIEVDVIQPGSLFSSGGEGHGSPSGQNAPALSSDGHP